jgi:hypothetical protein
MPPSARPPNLRAYLDEVEALLLDATNERDALTRCVEDLRKLRDTLVERLRDEEAPDADPR